MSAKSFSMSKLSRKTTSLSEAPSPIDSETTAVEIRSPAFSRSATNVENHLPQLTREWSFWSLFAFSTIAMGTWEGASFLLAQVFLNGGPAALLYGCIGFAIGLSCVYASLAELASLQPMIGAQYVWTAQFAPRKIGPFATFVQGWLTTLAWQSSVPAIAYLTASQIQADIILLSPTYVPQNWHVCLIMVGLLLFSCMGAILWKRSLRMVAILVAVFHFLALIACIATGLATEHFADNSFVWENDQSLYAGKSPSISFCVGFLTIAFAFAGGESAVHLAEETHRPEITVPRAMMTSFVVGTIGAFAISVVLVYGITDVVAILTTKTGSPFVEIFRQSTGSDAAAATLSLSIATMGTTITTVALINASRLTWAFARDGGFAGKALYLDRISPSFGVPMCAVLANTTVAILVSLIVIGSPIVFQGVISFAPLSLYTSYFVTIACFLHYRLVKRRLEYGPWHLGKFGVPINIFAICVCLFLIIFLPVPLVYPVSWANMNFAGPVLGLLLVVITATWLLGVRKYFRGPIIQIRVAGENGQEGFTVFSRAEWLSEDTTPL